jgi:hypothetical protein
MRLSRCFTKNIKNGDIRERHYLIHPVTLIYVTAFPNRQTFTRFTAEIAWETEVWVSDNPSHLIHFNGDNFLG